MADSLRELAYSLESPQPNMVNVRSDQVVYIMFTCAFCVGIYFSTFLQSLRCLLFTRKGWELRSVNSIQWPILLVSISIFTLSAVNHGVEIKFRGQEALLGVQIENWRAIVICTTANLTVQLTDGVLVFRLWKVYSDSYRIIILPVILWIGGLVLTALEIYLLVLKVALFRVWLPVKVDVGPGIILTPFWASTILLNLYATTMIIYRLRKFKQESVFGHTTQTVDFAASLIIESGALYLVPATVHFVAWWTQNDFAININIASDINIPLVGIAFNLIIIRLSKHREQDQGTEMHITALRFELENTVKTEDSAEMRSLEPPV